MTQERPRSIWSSRSAASASPVRARTLVWPSFAWKDWAEREDPALNVQALAGRSYGAFTQIQDALVFPVVPPSVIELGNASGFDFYLQARGGQTHEQLLEARNQMLGMAAQARP